ncbi:MAG: transcription elongation factor GreAB, partial [Acidobacteriota bacterium]|nr:transcription elongation factor GreAB [Acidobacteriota bacterium]
TRIRKLRSFGIREDLVLMTANCRRGHWYIAGGSTLSAGLSAESLPAQGLTSLHQRSLQLGTVC